MSASRKPATRPVVTSLLAWAIMPGYLESARQFSPAQPAPSRRKKPTSWSELSRKAARRLMNTAGSVLLDTNVVVAHLRNDPDLTARLRADRGRARYRM